MIQELLAPNFVRRENLLLPRLSFADYQKLPGFNASLLKEPTTYEMLEKLLALSVLPVDMQRLLELTGGTASDAIQFAQELAPRTTPRPFLRFVRMPDSGENVTMAQQKIMDAVYLAQEQTGEPMDAREFHGATVNKCLGAQWLKVEHREIAVDSATENVKESRTLALVTGEATHAAILEPHMFDADKWQDHWQLSPTAGLTTKAALEAQAEDPRRLITPEIVDTARRCRDAVWKHDLARQLLSVPGKSECSGQVWDPEMECMRKFRVDRLPDDRSFVADVKTTRLPIIKEVLNSEVKKRSYDIQMSYYGDGLSLLEDKPMDMQSHLIWVRNSAPFIAHVTELRSDLPDKCHIEAGRSKYKERLAAFVLAYNILVAEGRYAFEAYEHTPAWLLTR